MGRQLFFREINENCGTMLSEFFRSNDQVLLFYSLYYKVKAILPDVIIRGIPGDTFGVSMAGERCIFYVTSKPDKDSFDIRFRGLSNEIEYKSDNSEELSEKTITEACRRRDDPKDYQIVGQQNAGSIESKEEEKFGKISLQQTINYACTDTFTAENDSDPLDHTEISNGHEEETDDMKRTGKWDDNVPGKGFTKQKDLTKDKVLPLEFDISDDDIHVPFYIQYDVDPSDYERIEISNKIFSVRASNSLLRAGIMTLENLLKYSPYQLRYQVKNFGRKSLKEITNVLDILFSEKPQNIPMDYNDPIDADLNPAPDDNKPTKKDNNLSIYDAERKEFHDWIKQIKEIERSTEVDAEACEEFSERIKEWMLEFLSIQEGIEERSCQIFIRKVTNRETLENIGKDYKITRERVRQLLMRVTNRIALCAYRKPKSESMEKIRELISLIRSLEENEVFVYLKYVYHQSNVLVQQILSFFFYQEEVDKLIKDISHSPKVRSKPKAKKPKKIPPVPTGRLCPWCGSELVIYTAHRGAHPGSIFVGCSSFPKCRYRGFLTMDDVHMLAERDQNNENNVDWGTGNPEPDID